MLLVLAASPLLGVHWFTSGDFVWREAMTYHGAMVPAWMLLILATGDLIQRRMPVRLNLLVPLAAAVAGFFVVVGSFAVRGEGLSFGSGLIAVGLALADLVAIVVLAYLIRDTWRAASSATDRLLRWTLVATLGAVSISTPLGHLAGAVKEFGVSFGPFKAHLAIVGGEGKELIANYISSHGHEAMGGFLAALLVALVISRKAVPSRRANFSNWPACLLILLGTLVQVAIYQVSAWTAWEPPVVLSSGPNGLPLDDLVLGIVGTGQLLLLPALLCHQADQACARRRSPQDSERFFAWAAIAGVLAYVISVPLMGIYIEFHEEFFGHAQGNATGVPNDLAYIRAHLVVGLMLLSVLMTAVVTAARHNNHRLLRTAAIMSVITSSFCAAGAVIWTATLKPALAQVSYIMTILVFGLVVAHQWARMAELLKKKSIDVNSVLSE